jgi:hypothetical protein
VSATSWVRAPLDRSVANWNTVSARRRILVVVHTVTAANRLADVLDIFDSDPRLQLVFTTPGSSVISEGVLDELSRLGGLTIPWDQAIAIPFDLALSANHSGNLSSIRAPVVLLSHGIGYTKYSPETRNQKPETRNQKPETRNQESRAVYGLSREWLLRDGVPFAAALVLSHDDQRAQVAAAVPEAAGIVVVAGDPSYDRLRASRGARTRYRAALGVPDGGTLVVLSSTWGPRSLYGDEPDLPRRVLAELPLDTHRVAMVLHPNAWFAHGTYQVRHWLAGCRRAGLTLVPPQCGWQQAILAADVLVGDHGAVTGYGAALGVPTLLAGYDDAEVPGGTAIAALGAAAPRLDPYEPLAAQFAAAQRIPPERYAAVTALASSAPDAAAGRLRALCYRLMDLDEPAGEPPVPVLPAAELPAPAPRPTAALVTGEVRGTGVTLRRYPADARHAEPRRVPEPDAYLCTHLDHPLRTLRETAAVVYRGIDEIDRAPTEWLAATHRAYPAATVTAVLEPDGCLAYAEPGPPVRLAGAAPDALAAVPYLLLRAGHRWESLPERLSVDLGIGPRAVTVSRLR